MTGRDRLADAVTPSDEELMVSVSRGDLAAFGNLVLRHQSSAWSAAYRFLGDRAEAEDISQEAFLKIFEASGRYQPTAKFRTYLYRVVTRLCMDHSERKRPRYTDDLPDAADPGGSPVDNALSLDAAEQVRLALDALAPNQRMAVILKYYEGLGYAEIATVMETTTKAVERLLARGRETLEKKLAAILD